MAQAMVDVGRLVPLSDAATEMGTTYPVAWRLFLAGELGGLRLGRFIFVDRDRLAAVAKERRMANGSRPQ